MALVFVIITIIQTPLCLVHAMASYLLNRQVKIAKRNAAEAKGMLPSGPTREQLRTTSRAIGKTVKTVGTAAQTASLISKTVKDPSSDNISNLATKLTGTDFVKGLQQKVTAAAENKKKQLVQQATDAIENKKEQLIQQATDAIENKKEQLVQQATTALKDKQEQLTQRATSAFAFGLSKLKRDTDLAEKAELEAEEEATTDEESVAEDEKIEEDAPPATQTND